MRSPYLTAPIDDFADPECTDITLCFAAQSGKTTILQVQSGYAVDHAPGPAMLVMGNEDQAKRYSEKRWLPLIDGSPALAAHKPADPDLFRKLEQSFDRMSYSLVGSNSPTNLSSTPIRYLWLDEVDKYPGVTAKEASACDLASKRTRSYGDARKIVKASTPTVPEGEIWTSFRAGDQRYFHIPCPLCGALQRLQWRHVVYPRSCQLAPGVWDLERVADLARYRCPECAGLWGDADKGSALELGRWIARQPPRSGRPARHRSYHLSALYPRWVTFGELACQWLEAQGVPAKLKDFVQNTLAEPWRERGEVATADSILSHREPYPAGSCPEQPARVILSVDVQKHVCWYVVRAWGRHETSWLIEYGCAPGLEAVREIAGSTYDGPSGPDTLRITNKFIDSGAFTDDIYGFAKRSGFVPTKGYSESQAAQPLQLTTLQKWNLPLLRINADHYKDAIQSRLAIALGQPGAWHLHRDTGTDYAEHLTAEEQFREKSKSTGRLRVRWKQIRDSNHLLDCEVIQLAAAQWLGVRSRPAGPTGAAGAASPSPATRRPFINRPSAPMGGRRRRQ